MLATILQRILLSGDDVENQKFNHSKRKLKILPQTTTPSILKQARRMNESLLPNCLVVGVTSSEHLFCSRTETGFDSLQGATFNSTLFYQ